MKKRLCSFFIATALLISILPQTAFAAADNYGTEAEGITGNALSLTPLTELKNGDFESGLKYWGGYSKKGMEFEGAAIKADGSNRYLEINRETGDSQRAYGVLSVPFKISGLSAGDEIYLGFDYRVKMNEANNSSQAPLVAALKSVNNSTSFSTIFEFKTPGRTDIAKWARGVKSAAISSLPASGEDTFYITFYVNYNVAAKLDIDNIVIAVRDTTGDDITPDGYYELLDGTLVTEDYFNSGTEANGIYGNALGFTALSAFHNGTFENGLKYWGNQSKKGYASDVASIEKTGDNSYLVINRETPENAPQGVFSVPFKISGLAAGDVITVMYDYRTERYETTGSTRDFYAYLKAADGNAVKYTGGSADLDLCGGTPIENEYLTTPEGFTTVCTQTIVSSVADDGEPVFYFWIYLQYNAACKLSFDNFRVYVKHNGEDNYTPDGFCEATDGEKISDRIFKGCTVTDGSSDIASGANDKNYPGLVYSWVGTETDGIYTKAGYLGNAFPIRTKFENSDFSKGLQYWFESTDTGYTSDKVALKTEENGNAYITVGEKGASYQLNQTRFRLSGFNAGDKIYIMTKFRGFGNFGCNGYVQNAVEGTVELTKANGGLRTVYEPQSESEWGYSLSTAYFTVPSDEQINPATADTYGGEFSYYVMIYSSIYAEISDIMLVRKNSDGSYTDSDGNLFTLPENTNNYHYTAADGFDWARVYGEYRENISMLWAGAYSSTAALLGAVGNADTNGITVNMNLKNDGSLIFEDYAALNGEAASVIFTLPLSFENAAGKKILFEYSLNGECTKPCVGTALKSGTETQSSYFYGKSGEYAAGALSLDTAKRGKTLEISFKISQKTECRIRNATVGYDDIGGIDGLYATADGLPYGYDVGDANADGSTDILDLVRIKKYEAQTGVKIYFAASDCDRDGSISSTDLAALKKTLLAK